MASSNQILIIGSVWPEPDSSAAGSRMLQLIRLFRDRDWRVTFASDAESTDRAADLEALGLETLSITLNHSSFDDVIDGLQPDLVLFDRFVTEEQYGWRVAERCPGALRVIDTEDLHCLRRARKQAARQGVPFRRETLLDDSTALREAAAIWRSDLSLVISEAEMTLLEQLFGIDAGLLHYLPYLFDPLIEEDRQAWPNFEARKDFYTIGNFRHAPNLDAVQYAREQVWPLIRRELPEARYHVYGAYPTRQAREWHDPDSGFLIEGEIEDVESAVRSARICLAPLRFGAGLKGKLAEAMRHGTPSVTTPVGAEGIAGDLSWPGSVADAGQPEALARAAIRLYTDQTEWEEAQQQSAIVFNERFDRTRHEPGLMERLHTLRIEITQHRNSNFIGRMLRYHRHASTKYMGKWIEAKNG